tara:strand:- start:1072 stop:2256 length:1185 start_codon:yes stop_codon:yes gene_type:complete
MKILYVTYDGLLEPLGQSQVLAYQEKLSENFDIFLLSYEKPIDLRNSRILDDMQKRISNTSIQWSIRTYHKTPSILATAYDIVAGFIHCSYLVWKHKINIIHARSYPPALLALFLKYLFGVKFIFDMRGFWADERVDGNIWTKDSFIYKLTKKLERSFILNADHIISLTNAAVEEIKNFPYVEPASLNLTVISTCVDLEKFSPRLNINKSDFTLGYLGTVGTWYLFQETIYAFQALLKIIPDAKILIINKNEHNFIRKSLKKHNISMSSIEIISASYDEVPDLIKRMDATVFFLKPLFSKQASAPTKLGEFLASGVPCLTNDGVGDVSEIIQSHNVGVTINDLSDTSITNGIKGLIELTKQEDIIIKCREAALLKFSLEDGIGSYSKIYKSLSY